MQGERAHGKQVNDKTHENDQVRLSGLDDIQERSKLRAHLLPF